MVRTTLRTTFLALALVACGGDDDGSPGSPDAADDVEEWDAGPPDCYENPTTHLEIINACTDAQKIEKDPVLPLLNDDGSLPALPR